MPDALNRLQQFVRPHASITDPSERQRAYTLSSLLLGLVAVIVLGIAIGLFALDSSNTTDWYFVISGAGFALIIYGISRTRYYRIAARLFIICNIAMIAVAYWWDVPRTPNDVFMFLVMVIMIAALVLPRWQMMAVIASAVITVLLLAVVKPVESYDWYITLMFIGMVSVTAFVWVTINAIYRREAQDAQQRYRDLMNANDEAIVVIDYDTAAILDANPAFERITGYAPDDIIGRYPIEFVNRASQKITGEYWRRRDHSPHELEGIRKDGKPFYIEVTLKPYRFRNRPAYALIIRDIHERKEAQAQLHASEQRFEAIFNNTFQFMGLLDPDGTVREINQTVLDFLGAESGQVVGKPMWQAPWWHMTDAQRRFMREKIRHAATGEFVRFEVPLIGKNQQEITVDFSIKPIRDEFGNIAMLIPEGRDITARKIEAQIRTEFELRYQALFTHTADAVFIIDLDGNPIGANHRAEEMLRCDLDQIVSGGMEAFVAEDDVDKSFSILQRLKDNEAIPPVYERKMKRADGETFIGEISAMMVRDPDGEPLYVQSMIRDTSERRLVEQQKFELRMQRERTDMLSRFITQASHHFRTPITNIKTSSYLLSRIKDNPEKRDYHVQVIRKELERLNSILNDLLMVTRLEKESTEEYHIARIHIHVMMRDLKHRVEGKVDYPKFTWEWRTPEDDKTIVIGDEPRLIRAMLNLLENAMSYTDEGGTIRVRSYNYNHWVVLEVEDTGIGIAPDDIGNIFENFYRSAVAQERDSTSSGLGLPITKKVVERHKGEIRIISDVGEGTLVQVLLPIMLDWSTAPPPRPDTIHHMDVGMLPSDTEKA